MTIAVKIVSHPIGTVRSVLYETSGNNKKRTKLHDFKDSPEFETHIWKGRDLVLQEEDSSEEK